MAEQRRLPREIVVCIKAAWEKLLKDYKEKNSQRWIDSESESGYLKDVDHINTLIEPYLLAPTSFVDPPMPPSEIYEHVKKLMILVAKEAEEQNEVGGYKYRGFSPEPYWNMNIDLDYTDSASSTVQLISNVVKLAEQCKEPIPEDLLRSLNETARSAVEFLLETKIDDEKGCRWQGTAVKTVPSGKYANMMFTSKAAIALHNALENVLVKRWIGDSMVGQVREALAKVPQWIIKSYNSDSRHFWLDDTAQQAAPQAAIYAIETIYTLFEDDIPDNISRICNEAVGELLGKMKELGVIAEMQRETPHTIPVPSVSKKEATIFYDDRHYVGAFLSAFILMRKKEGSVANDAFIKVTDLLYQGLTGEWKDASALWDDGRPLICYTYDAIMALVLYGLAGEDIPITLREHQIRDAVIKALSSKEVIEEIVEAIKDRGSRLEFKADFENILK